MSAITLKTEIPGPKSKALAAAFTAQVPRGISRGTPVFVAKAHGTVLEDVDGNRLLDFSSGIGVTNTGHTPASVVAAIAGQAAAYLHLSVNMLGYEGYLRLAERLNLITPGNFPKKTIFANSGAEAVENAIKLARVHTGRQAVVCFDHAFHGRTYMAMSLTAKYHPYKEGFAPYCPEVYRAPAPYLYRWPGSSDPETVSRECLAGLAELVHTQVGENNVAAILIEPVQGEGGFLPAPAPFLRGLRHYCDQHRIVLIADEIQSGFGRTGTLFACEQLGLAPDLITMAKGLGGGMPISAVTGRAEIMDAAAPGGIGGTYGGNPVSCAAALAVLDLFATGNVLAQSRRLGETLARRLDRWQARFPGIGDVRGLGTMRGVEFVKDRASKEPDKDAVNRLVRYNYEHGVITLSAGTYGNVLRFLPPLTASEDELNEGLDIIEAGLQAVLG